VIFVLIHGRQDNAVPFLEALDNFDELYGPPADLDLDAVRFVAGSHFEE
jgi:hypothetical protein